jgi:hypothetical protein
MRKKLLSGECGDDSCHINSALKNKKYIHTYIVVEEAAQERAEMVASYSQRMKNTNTYIHTYIHTYIRMYIVEEESAQERAEIIASNSQRMKEQETDHANTIQALNDAHEQQMVKLRGELEDKADYVRHVTV